MSKYKSSVLEIIKKSALVVGGGIATWYISYIFLDVLFSFVFAILGMLVYAYLFLYDELCSIEFDQKIVIFQRPKESKSFERNKYEMEAYIRKGKMFRNPNICMLIIRNEEQEIQCNASMLGTKQFLACMKELGIQEVPEIKLWQKH